MNTMENNKLIVELIGIEKFKDLLADKDGNIDLSKGIHEQSKFHSSWDQLMPVIEKIESMGYHVVIDRAWCCIYSFTLNKNFHEIIKGVFNNNTKIANTYEAVVEFAKWHNEEAL